MFFKIFLAAMTLCTLIAASTFAEIPQSFNYQGLIVDDQGNPVTDDSYSVTFKIYGSAGGTDVLWTSSTIVSTSVGVFTHEIGSLVPLPDGLFAGGATRFLGITIGTDSELHPRTQLTAVPYSFLSENSDAAYSIECTGCIASAEIADGSIQFEDIGQNGATADQVIKWNGAAWEAADDNSGSGSNGWIKSGNYLHLENDSDTIAIGTIEPYSKFQINYTMPGGSTLVRFGASDLAIEAQADFNSGITTTGINGRNVSESNYTTGVNGFTTGYGTMGNYGVKGSVGASSTNGYGVYGHNYASGTYGYLAGDTVGVSGKVYDASHWAGLFEGKLKVTQTGAAPVARFELDNTSGDTAVHITSNGSGPALYFNVPSENLSGTLGGPYGAVIGISEDVNSYGVAGVNTNSYGILGYNDTGVFGSPNVNDGIGVSGYIDESLSGTAVYGFVESGNGVAVSGQCGGASGSLAHGDSIGVYGEALSGDWAGYFDGNVYASDSVGIGTTAPEATLHVNGNQKFGTAANEFEIMEELNTDSDPWDTFIASNGISIGNNAGGNRQKFLFTDGSGNSNIFTIANSTNSGDNWYSVFEVQQDGKVGIGNSSPGTKLSVAGLTGTSSYNNVVVNTSTGDFYYQTSTKRNKLNIQPFEEDFDRIFQAEPKIYTDKASGQTEIGFIAEEFDELGLKELVIYDAEGRPNGLKYEMISLYLLEVMKERDSEYKELNDKVERLETLLNQLLQNN